MAKESAGKEQNKNTARPAASLQQSGAALDYVASADSILAAAGATPPPVQRSVEVLQRANGAVARQIFRSLQGGYGNAYAARLAAGLHGPGAAASASLATPAPLVQRHPAGAAVLPQAEAIASELANPGVAPPAAATPPAPGGVTGSPAPPSPTAGAALGAAPGGGVPTAEAAPGGTPGTAGTATMPAPAGGGSGAAATAPVSSPALQAAFAQRALQTSFGDVASRPIVRGGIHVVSGEDAILAACDTVNIRNNATNPITGAVWVAGDAGRTYRDRGLRLNGFADPNSPDLWVDDTTTDPTTTVHEMLHINTAAGFRAAVGEVINEGTTERLAVQAVTAAGQSVAGSENTYAQERALVERLVAVVGEPTLTNAYFNGANSLIQTYELLMGARSFALLKRVLDASPPNYDTANALLRPPSTAQRIALINGYLDWWVSDEDLTNIETVFNSSSDADKQAIRTAIQPRIISLTSIGQRTRLRLILGVV